MLEPITYLFNQNGFDNSKIEKIIFGYRFVAVMNKDGNIGVCATLGTNFKDFSLDNSSFDLNDIRYRILLTAYYNSIFNYHNFKFGNGDIIQNIDFKKYRNIVMIGHFRSTVEKLKEEEIDISIFDFEDEQTSLPIEQQPDYLKKCDLAIVTATSVFNNTFSGIINKCNGDIHIMGPTTIMHQYFFDFEQVKALYGSRFKKFDTEVLNIIKDGLGTKQFLRLGEKVFISRNDSL